MGLGSGRIFHYYRNLHFCSGWPQRSTSEGFSLFLGNNRHQNNQSEQRRYKCADGLWCGTIHSLPITEASAAPNFLNCGNVNGLYSIVSNVNCVGCRSNLLLTPGAGANRSYDRAEHSDPDKHHQHDVDVGRQHTLLAGLRYSGDLYRIGDHFLCAQWFRKSQHGHDGRFGKHRRGRSVSKQQLYGSCIDVGRNPNRDFRGTWGCDDDYPCLRDDWLRRERSGSDESADYC